MVHTTSGLGSELETLGGAPSPASPSCQRPRNDSKASPTAVPLSAAARKVAQILAGADVHVNGGRPWDLQVHNQRVYRRVLSEGVMGAGESYMEGWWDVEALDEFFTRIQRADVHERIRSLGSAWLALKGRIFNRQAKSRSRRVAEAHYDLGNDIYEAMLDRRMQYTCGYWMGARDLDEAQVNKLHLISRKLHLRPRMNVLDLGGGFGGLAHFLATEYGCQVVSYNISKEQVRYGRELCKGLPVRFEEKDYREAVQESEQFDRIVAIGLCEHIGHKNYRRFLALLHGRLRDGGMFLLHTIGSMRSFTSSDPWIDKYIFPNGMFPSITQLGAGMEGLWVVEDWHNFGPDYDKTLLAWWDNFERAWPNLRLKYGDRFYRMWKYYIMCSAGAFRARNLQLWQLVLSKGDIPSYTPVR